MYARLSRFAGLPPERIDRTLAEFEESQLSQFEALEGFKGVLVGVDRAEGKAMAITFWESQNHLRASDRLADQAREAAMETASMPSREPIVDRYEVVLQRET
jgi:heme-degrading monooxygenase HmoA